jgi:hypothetical protein
MFDRRFILNAINRSAENRGDRRRFLKSAGGFGLGLAASTFLGVNDSRAAAGGATGAISDAAILNFALNLEYLEAEFYQRAVNGTGLPPGLTTGKGTQGTVKGGRQVNFVTPSIRQYAQEIAADELEHVKFLRSALGGATVAEPAININSSFTAAAKAAGLGSGFDAYANENNFLLAAFIFEDVGVTAYKGAAPLISNKTYLDAAAGILAVEAYHASNIRTTLYARGIEKPKLKLPQATVAISNLRDSVDGPQDDDQGIVQNGMANIVPADQFGKAFGRTPGEVLNVVYLTKNAAAEGGFFPKGVNGQVTMSSASGAS